jgi:hypothetical protein
LQNRGKKAIEGQKFKDYSHHARKYLFSISFDERRKGKLKVEIPDKNINEN